MQIIFYFFISLEIDTSPRDLPSTPIPIFEPPPTIPPWPPFPTFDSPTPTHEPSSTPTLEPSPVPTLEPFPTPTLEPSPTPTLEPSPTPSPEPTPTPWVPPIPFPTPTPLPPAYYSKIAYVSNITHSIKVSFDSLFWSGQTKIKDIFGNFAQCLFYFSPFHEHLCPDSFNCFFEQISDIWVCFENNNCYPLMIEKYGITSKSSNLDSGIFVEAQGVYNLKFVSELICDNSSEFNLVDSLYYSDGIFSSHFKTYQACPQNEIEPIIPTPLPYPTQPPSSNPYSSKYISSSLIYDFQNFDYVQSKLLTNEYETRTYSDLIFSPKSLMNCPKNSDCLGTYQSNAYRCWNSSTNGERFCISYANSYYYIQPTKTQILYSGGFAGASLLIKLQCNESLPENILLLDSTGSESIDKVLQIQASSNSFCNLSSNSASFGGIFLTSIFFISVLYFGIGIVFSFYKNGILELPHKQIWNNFIQLIVIGFNTITCRSKGYSPTLTYLDL